MAKRIIALQICPTMQEPLSVAGALGWSRFNAQKLLEAPQSQPQISGVPEAGSSMDPDGVEELLDQHVAEMDFDSAYMDGVEYH
jgi:hypothetical protein